MRPRFLLPTLLMLPLLLILPMLTTTASARSAHVDFYVATNGNDVWSGKLLAPNSARNDGPFATLQRAIEAARSVEIGRGNFAGINIFLRGGVYSLSQTVLLTEKNSTAAPLEIANYQQEQPKLIGGRELRDWKLVTDEAVLSRMDPMCRGKVYQTDMAAQGVTDAGAIVRNAWDAGGNTPGPSELFFGDKPMTIARWPNTGYATIADVPMDSAGKAFTYAGDRPTRWKDAPDGWMHGYWAIDWADSYIPITGIDTDKHTLKTAAPLDGYGINKGQRWIALNLLEELDTPGEYYIDHKNKIAYFWPPAPLSAGKAYISLMDTPLITLKNTSGVTIQGLILEDTRGEGIRIEGGSHNLVAGCTLRNMGQMGVRITGGQHNSVQSCDLYEMGQGGIALDGGDRKTLVSGENSAVNNLIHDYSNWIRCYRPAIGIDGVGQTAANNLIYGGPHTAILLGGNNHQILRNEIHNVCTDTGDVGAFYMGRDWTMRGNKISGNYFHHLGGFKGEGFTDAMAVYLDDAASGATVFQNVFYKAGRAVMIGGGRDIHVLNNCFIECSPSVHVDARGTGWAKDHIKKGGDWQMYEKLAAVQYDQPPYSVAYPELAPMLSDEPNLPKGTVVTGNIALGGKWMELQDMLTEEAAGMKNNTIKPANPYVGLSDRQLLEHVLTDYPVLGLRGATIGLHKDRYRRSLPK